MNHMLNLVWLQNFEFYLVGFVFFQIVPCGTHCFKLYLVGSRQILFFKKCVSLLGFVLKVTQSLCSASFKLLCKQNQGVWMIPWGWQAYWCLSHRNIWGQVLLHSCWKPPHRCMKNIWNGSVFGEASGLLSLSSPELELLLFHLLEERPIIIAGRAAAVKPGCDWSN